MNRAYIKRLENLIRLDCTLSDLDSERATGNLERDMPFLRKAAETIRASRRTRDKLPTGACFFGSMNR
jgi:hypothetical protein